jgi:hypothetical protein
MTTIEDDDRIQCVFTSALSMLCVSVPKFRATEDFTREIATAKFLEVSLHPDNANIAVRITWDDGSEHPFSVILDLSDFSTVSNNQSERGALPVKGRLKFANVSIHDPELYDAHKAGTINQLEYASQILLWRGLATTEIVKEKNGYGDSSSNCHLTFY